jgi:hypothetical protein
MDGLNTLYKIIEADALVEIINTNKRNSIIKINATGCFIKFPIVLFIIILLSSKVDRCLISFG